MSAFGAVGPSMIAFLHSLNERAKAASNFEMWQKSELHYTWNTMVASSFWDMRLNVACGFRFRVPELCYPADRTLNFPLVARQLNAKPKLYAAYRATRCHLDA